MRWIVLVVALASCAPSRADEPAPTRAFYYWRTTLKLSAAERHALAGVTAMYLRVFDIDADGVIVGKIDGERVPSGLDIVPVVFIRQDAWKKLDRGQRAQLAAATWAEVARRAARLGFVPHELQLDCDWTEATREAFFDFVRQVRAASGVRLSATIRLHQVKYREKTGVPPVERGMLMFYNMGEFSPEPGTKAIFDERAAGKYLARIHDYPLPLDVALPIWSWTVHVRDDVVIDLLQSTDPDELPGLDFLEPAGTDRFRATRTAFLHGTLLRDGDVLKVERMAPADTLAAAALVAPHLGKATRTLSLFELSERNLARYDDDQLAHIFDALR